MECRAGQWSGDKGLEFPGTPMSSEEPLLIQAPRRACLLPLTPCPRPLTRSCPLLHCHQSKLSSFPAVSWLLSGSHKPWRFSIRTKEYRGEASFLHPSRDLVEIGFLLAHWMSWAFPLCSGPWSDTCHARGPLLLSAPATPAQGSAMPPEGRWGAFSDSLRLVLVTIRTRNEIQRQTGKLVCSMKF